jgi:23S rRNA pseudouridine1911/1915/1917 synthase
MEHKMERLELISPNSIHVLSVTPESHNIRLDKFVGLQFPLYSRTFFQRLIDEQAINLNGQLVSKPSIRVKTGDAITIKFPPERTTEPIPLANQELGIQIIYKHEHFLIIDKPAGLLVHASSSASTAITLVDWLLAHYKEIAHVGYIDRPGIVHRLDKDTSGVMVIPRTQYAHKYFGALFKDRKIHKTYLAIVHGHPEKSGTIDLAITRNQTARHKMAAVEPDAYLHNHISAVRMAVTHYQVLEYFEEHALVQAKPITGRTHQIRVHMAGIGHPLVGDQIYGKKSKAIKRQALHAHAITFEFDGQQHCFKVEPPEDFKKLAELLHEKKA